MGRFFDRWLFSQSWRALIGQFLVFALFFAIYDVSILYLDRTATHGVSLVNYAVRDERTDESVMYVAAIRDMVDGHYRSTDPYLKEHREAPAIRPQLPVWIGYFAYCLGGSMNAAVLLLHTLLPAAGAVMLVCFFAGFVQIRYALVLAILAIGGSCYALNNYLEWLHLAKLAGPYSYSPEMHLFSDVPNHVRFNRFFSPGITFPLMMIGLLPMLRDPNWNQRRSLIVFGIALGLQLYVYPHASVFLGFVGAAFLLLGLRIDYRAGYQARAIIAKLARQTAWIGAAGLLTAIPFLRESAHFHASAEAADIMSRIGFVDEYYGSVRTPVMMWLVLALVLKLSANHLAGRGAWNLFSTSKDRLWLALTIGSALATWLPGLLSEAVSFPTPWLIPLRIVAYFVPLLVGYPLVEWIHLCRPSLLTRPWASALRKRAIAAYCALLVFGELAAASHNAEQYKITDEMAQFRKAVIENTAPDSIVMTDDLRLAAWLVCETDRNLFIGYGASSNASNVELLQRLMTVSIVQGRTFDEFYQDCYLHGLGLPNGPSGEHWTLHHGRVGLPYNYHRLSNLYSKLAERSPEKLLSRYRCDYVHLKYEKMCARYSELMAPTSDSSLHRLKLSNRKVQIATTNAKSRKR